MDASAPLRYLVQGEYDYARSIEIDAGGRVRTFSGSYVTHGPSERALSKREREALRLALAELPAPFDRGAEGPSLRHRLEVGDRAWSWRGAADDVPGPLRAVVRVLAQASTAS